MFAANHFYDFAKLLGASAQTADFQRDDRIAFLHSIQQHLKVLLHNRIAMLIFKNHFFGSCCFQFPNLAVDVLFIFIRAATSRISSFCLPCQRKDEARFLDENRAF